MTKELRVLADLDFAVVAEPHEYTVDYKIYEIVGTDGETEKPLFHKAGSISYPDSVEDVESAEVFASGHVKWDGCSNWTFDSQENCMLHFCGPEALLNIGKVLVACWDMTKELCPNWIDL